ncbi:hypothetical protein FACS189447_03400 [Spirochaetia bacterium]|nr:hypothetical protein FACS189447_03400 [Spirochaetia bacterium]
MKAKHQAPSPKIEIYNPENSETPFLTFDRTGTRGAYTGLLSYTYSDGVDDLDGSFSFTVENDIKNNVSIFDMIWPRDIVKIYEDTEKPVFIGIMKRKKINAAMTERGVRRGIQFSGYNILSAVSNFILSMDIKIMNVNDAQIESKKLTTALARENGEHLDILTFLKETWEAYTELSLNGHKISDSGMVKIIEKFILKDDGSFFEVNNNDSEFAYNIANSFYNQGQNKIMEIWRNILPSPIYELFPRINASGTPKLVVRETPFDAESWKTLNKYEIDPLDLEDYDLTQSDDEVYTVFNSFLEGSVLSHDQYTIISQVVHGGDSTIKMNVDKLGLYGYRPLEVSFRGYARKDNVDGDNNSNIINRFAELNERVMYWYSRLDEMLSGSISIATDFHATKRPRSGERAGFLGGEFYINKTERSWSYGGTPKTNLTVTRGMKYNQDGTQANRMEGLGKRLIELSGEVR